MPEITHTLADFQSFAAKHSVSLVRITIQELMDELAKRACLLACDSEGADVVWAVLKSSGNERILAGVYSTYDSITFLLRKYKVGIHVHILYLQVFNSDDSQYNEVDLGKQVKIINICLTFAFPI